jgi:hypothetical protein
MPHLTGDPPIDERLDDVIHTYLEARQAGLEPDRKQLLESHPDLAAGLERFFAAHDELERLYCPLRDVAQAVKNLVDVEDAVDGPHPSTPQEFGNYDLPEVLGVGGMGVVYRAHDRVLNRDVALKQIITGPLATESDVQRFRNEAEAAAQVEHPTIVPIHEVGEHQGRR